MKPLSRLTFILLLGTVMVSSPQARAQETSPERYAVALQLNRGDSGPLLRGWPWIVVATAAYSDESGKPVMLDALAAQLTVVDASGKPVTWPWQRKSTAAGSLSLDATNEAAEVRWILSAEQTAALADGHYELRFAWGDEQAEPRKITVQAAPASLSAEQQVRRSLLAVAAAPGQANIDQAIRALDDALAKQPQSLSWWTERATLLKDAGRIDEAAKSIQKAITLFEEQNPRSQRPPVMLQRIRGEIMRQKIAEVVARRGQPTVAPATTTAPAATFASTPAAPAAATSSASASPIPASNSSPAPKPAATVSSAAAIDERAQTQWVASTELTETQILAEPNGQWAASARASSEYGKDSYSAAKTTGQPNVRLAGNDPEAWCPAEQNSGVAWLELTFARPVHATGVRVRQNDNPGAISRVEAIDSAGQVHIWWEGKDPFQPPRVRDIAWFALRFPKTDYAVAQVKVTLNLAAVPGWKEIDAVQLVGEP